MKFFVVVLIFFFHISYLLNGFTWLDHGDIEEGRAVVPLADLSGAFFTRFARTGFYRSVVTIINSIDYTAYGHWAPGYHLTNVLLHVGVSLMTAAFVGIFFSLKRWEKTLVAVLVGVHPIAILPVGAISYRQELLVLLFSMMTVVFHAKARVHGCKRYGFWAMVSFAAALLSKETALFLVPAWIGIWEIRNFQFQISNFKFPIKKINGRLFISELFIIIVYLLLRFRAVPEGWRVSPQEMPFEAAIATRILVVGRLMIQLLVPVIPSLSDATRIVSFADVRVVVTLTLIVSLLIGMVGWGIRSEWGNGLILLFVSLIPAFNIVPVPRFSSSHYGYIALPGMAIIVILLLRTFKSHVNDPLRTSHFPRLNMDFMLRISLLIWFLVASISTYQAGFRFREDMTLFKPEVAKDDRFAEGHFYLGFASLRRGDAEAAQIELDRAAVEDPRVIAYVDHTALFVNRAGAMYAQGKLDEADSLLTELSEKSPETSQLVSYNRAVIADAKGDYQRVIMLLEKDALRIGKKEAILLLAKAYTQTGRKEDAARLLQTNRQKE